jgi:RNA polymerase sigma factor (sigma-70 family)
MLERLLAKGASSEANEQRREGLRLLHLRYAGRFERYFRHRVPGVGQEEIAELVQDTFLTIVRTFANPSGAAFRYEGERQFRAWLWQVAKTRLLDRYRERQGQPEFEDVTEIEEQVGSEDRESVVDLALKDCVRKAFEEFRSAEPARADALAKVAWLGWEPSEVAQQLGRTPGAAREYLSQCRKKLQPFLERCRQLLK